MALNNFIGKRKWKTQFEAGREAADAGDFAAAEANLRNALEHAVNISERDSSYGDTALLLGQVYRRTERYGEALQMSQKAFDYYESVFGLTDPRTVQAHLAIVLAEPLEAHSDLDVRKATHELARAQFGETSWQAVRTAALALPSFSPQERENVLADVRNACNAVLGEERLSLATWPPVAEEFAEALLRAGLPDLAARFQSSQLKMNEERFGAKSQEAGLARLRLGQLFLELGHPEKAEVAFSRALDSIRLKLGPRSPRVQTGVIGLALALARQKKLQEASPHLTEALVFLGHHQVKERIEVLVSLLEYKCLVAGTDSERGALWQELESLWERAGEDKARAEALLGLLDAQARLQQAWELKAADRLLQVVLVRVRKWRGPHHPDVAHVLMELSTCALSAEDRPRAVSYLEQSLALDEGVENLIRAVANYGRLGEWEKAKQRAGMVGRLLKSQPSGVAKGRLEAQFAHALLHCGETELGARSATEAIAQLPEWEQLSALHVLGQIRVIQGEWVEAVGLLRQCLQRMTDPYRRSLASVHLGWVLTQAGKFGDAKRALEESQPLLALRSDHPVGYLVKAVAAQIAFYSGNVYEGKELRRELLSFLAGEHRQTWRSLAVLALLEPFGPEEAQMELDVGTEILAAGGFPERSVYAFPFKDIACTGLRHLARALDFLEQPELARERLSQYRERFFSFHRSTNPQASAVYLTAAQLTPEVEERCEALEAALQGLRSLADQHIALFPTLHLLTKLYIKLGRADKALTTCRLALQVRQTPTLLEWMALLQSGQLPRLDPSPEPPASEVEPSGAGSEESPAISEPPLTEPLEEEPSYPAAEPSPAEPREAPVVVAAGGAADLSRLPMARTLSERGLPPSDDEVEEFLAEVKARYGEDPRPHLEARVLLALLYEEGNERAEALWGEAVALVADAEGDVLSQLENRAQDASRPSLVVLTLEARLGRETDLYGENAVETLDTQIRIARALEAAGRLPEASRRLTLVVEVLRSWFGTRSRRLLEPLGDLTRVSEALGEVSGALEYQLERHRILESGEGDAKELFESRVALLGIRALLGQEEELIDEARVCEREVTGFLPPVAAAFARAAIAAAGRVDQLHWRSDLGATLCEIGLRAVPKEDVSLGCAARVALAEMQFRKDYHAQAARLRKEAIDLAAGLDSETRAELYHLAAESCLRTYELEAARGLAERILEERIAQEGRKDVWAGRALLVLAEVDLKAYRLEGTETDIGMSSASLKGSPFWPRAQALKVQALFFLSRYEEAYALLESMPPQEALDLELKLAVWRGRAPGFLEQLEGEGESPLKRRWLDLERLPLELAVNLLEFFARAGQIGYLARGMTRIWDRITAVPPTDARHARLKLLAARLQFWEADWSGAAASLQQTLELIPPETIEFPEGLLANEIRGLLVSSLLNSGRAKQALARAQEGASEVADRLGEEDVRSVHFRTHLAQCYRATGRQDDALVLLDEILNPLQDQLGETHVLLRDVFFGLSVAFLDQGDVESARLSAEEALRIDKECRGLSFPFLRDLELLAELESGEDLPEALNLLDTALNFAVQVLPEEHPYGRTLQEKRQDLASRGAEAEAPAVSPLSATEDAPEEDSPESLFAMDPVEEELDEQVVPVAEERGEPEKPQEPEPEEEPVEPHEPEEAASASPAPFDEDEEPATTPAAVAPAPPEPAERKPASRGAASPVSYRSTTHPTRGVFLSTSASVEFEPGFPEVPLRLPHISEGEGKEDDSVTSGDEEEGRSGAEEVDRAEDPTEFLERLVSHSDPEGYLLPLAPVFFLPVPWKEATEAPFDARFDDLHSRFQKAYKKGTGWRQVVEEAVSAGRRDPDHDSGYFLFLIGAQLEKSGNLHTADVCLATAIELLESGPAYGAACHQAGRVAGRRGELARALEYFDRSAELAGEAELAVLKIDAAECQLGLGRPEEALLGFEEVFDYLSENAPKVQVLAVQAKMAQLHLLIGDPETSQALAEETQEALSPKNAGTYRVLGRILLSRAFARLGRHELALELAEKAWEGARPWSAKRRDGRRIAISNLVDIYCLCGRFDDAMELVHESGLTGWGLAEAEILLRAGSVCCGSGNLDHARKYLRLGKSFLSRFRSPALWRSCFLELEAEINLREGEYHKASAVCEEALVVFDREATGPVDRSRHIVRSARVAAAQGRTEQARHLLEQAHSLRDLHLGSEHPHTSSVEGLTAVLPQASA